MSKIRHYLRQPFPTNDNHVMVIIISSIIVVFILAMFQPFGLYFYKGNKLLAFAGFGVVTALGTSISSYIIPLLFKKFYDRENWTIGKNMLHSLITLIVISIGNASLMLVLLNGSIDQFIPILYIFLQFTLLVGLIPTIIITVIIQNKALKQNLKEAKELNRILSEKENYELNNINNNESLITIAGNTKEAITLPSDSILYLEASGNYISVNYWDQSKLKLKTIRETISQIEETLKPYDQFIRCHRAYIVNSSQIINIEGNSQGYRLSLRHTTNEVPVSRTYSKIFKEYLS